MTLGIGVIGAGFAGGTHARALRDMPGAKPVAITAAPVEHARAVADECGMRLEPDVASLCAAADVDVVIVASPTYLHADHAVAAARAGKHVFCEKPLARTPDQARAIVRACDDAGVRLGVGHVVRYFPEYRRAKELIDEGAIGRAGIATLTRGSFSVASARPWYQDAEKSGGVILDLMLHDLDVVRWWFGEPERVHARRLTGRAGALDYALATLRWTDGPIVQLEASWAEHDGFRTSFEVRGDAGMLVHDSRAASPLSTQVPGGAQAPAMIPVATVHETPYRRQLRDLIEHFGRGEDHHVTGRDALRSLELAFAVIEAADTGAVVRWR
ncbi:MAG TPA: Gfo/Idh/MocA family oxidoreductase [Candidatus Limnocylindria bacterium]